MAALGRFPARQIDRFWIFEVERRLLDVARDIDEHRAATARSRDVERGLQRLRQLFDLLDEPRVLDDRDRDAGDVALLKRVRADQVPPHLPGDADEGCRVHPGVRDRRYEVRRAGAGRRNGDSDPSRRSGVALRHVPRALLVPGKNVADARAPREGVVRGQNRAARDAEDDVDAFGLQRAQDRVRPVHPHANASR